MRRHLAQQGAPSLVVRLGQLRDNMQRHPNDIEAHISWLNTLIRDAELLDLGGAPDGPDRR